jgi:AmmeMemoRadiSam system protein B
MNSRRTNVALAFLFGLTLARVTAVEPPRRFAAMFRDVITFEDALAKESFTAPPGHHVTGITVPHHLLAADLIARGFRCAAGGNYERIILLSPDHFRRSRQPFATTSGTFETVFGEVRCDEAAVNSLLARCSKIAASSLFEKEHGIHAVLPFIAKFFPQAKLLPVVLRVDSQRDDWLALSEALAPLVDAKTLIVQSTDFSHYLRASEARRRDQQTLNVLALADPEMVMTLRQPGYLDSKAGQFVQMFLQKRIHHARPAVIANRNSQAYVPFRQEQTTSYIVQIFEPDDPPPPAWPVAAGDVTWFFAGDTFFGRRVGPKLSQPNRMNSVRDAILRITQGNPLALNLEGVLVPTVPEVNGARPLQLLMEEEFTLTWLKALNVRLASLANNHSADDGEEGLTRTANALTAAGIIVAREGEVIDAGPFRAIALSDLSNTTSPHNGRITRELVSRFSSANDAGRLLFALLHWGAEFQPEATPRQLEVLDWLGQSPVSAVFGAHPHVASPGPELWRNGHGLVSLSLGNFLFDQENGSGALAEVRFFENGTFATRWIPLGNLLYPTAPR